jgi:hypothetical protein
VGAFLEAFSACGYPVKLGVGARGPSALVSRGQTLALSPGLPLLWELFVGGVREEGLGPRLARPPRKARGRGLVNSQSCAGARILLHQSDNEIALDFVCVGIPAV